MPSSTDNQRVSSSAPRLSVPGVRSKAPERDESLPTCPAELRPMDDPAAAAAGEAGGGLGAAPNSTSPRRGWREARPARRRSAVAEAWPAGRGLGEPPRPRPQASCTGRRWEEHHTQRCAGRAEPGGGWRGDGPDGASGEGWRCPSDVATRQSCWPGVWRAGAGVAASGAGRAEVR
jgi:hypothetical protein